MSVVTKGVLRCAFFRAQLHSSATLFAKKRHRFVKHAVDYQNQRQVLVDFIQKGSLEGLDVVKEDTISAGSTLDRVSFDSHFLETCSELGAFNLGKDFFRRLYSEGRAGVGVAGKYFSLCHAHREQCDSEELKFLLKIYDEVLEKYGMLDPRTCEFLAKGIVLTDRWKYELPRLLEMVSQCGATPSSSLLSTAVNGALHQRDVNAAWEYMDWFVRFDRQILSETYEGILKYDAQLPLLLRWMVKNYTILVKDSAEVFVRLAPSQGVEAEFTQVSQSGLCRSCKTRLKPTPLSENEFSRLRDAFLDPVLIGKDVFQKTRPEELTSYHAFLDKVLPVDVVLDGLNIAYASRRMSSEGSRLLRSVTSHFAARSQKVLVVGRQHMKKWPAKDLNFIHDRAKVFLAEDISQDDPFLLYATLRSGLGTKFVSRDRMSSHRFLLKCPELRRIFSKWQALHQYHPLHISQDGSHVALRPPATFAREPQNTKQGLWHLPVVDHSQTHVEGHLQDETAPWLCVRGQIL